MEGILRVMNYNRGICFVIMSEIGTMMRKIKVLLESVNVVM